jgi:2-amino-4-hydroxy-6-hydroxymethyldihydropteridine diphosphokinase
MNKWNRVMILAGSNSGDTVYAMNYAHEKLFKIPHRFFIAGSNYLSEAWGKDDEADYLNKLFVFDTWLTPNLLLKQLLSIEHAFGRVRKEKWGTRTLDLDILFYGNLILDIPHLSIPHKFIAERHFVLKILSDYCPDFIHPVYQKTSTQLFAECKDKGKIIRLPK